MTDQFEYPVNDGKSLVVFATTINHIRNLDIVDKESAVALTQSAMRQVVMQLAENDIHGAIDSMEKTAAIEQYIKAKVAHQKANLQTANLVTVGRFRILREIGGWLDEHVNHNNSVLRNTLPNNDKPKFSLREIGVTEDQSKHWQYLYRFPEDKFEEFVTPYIKNGINGKEHQLYWMKLYNVIKPNLARDVRRIHKPEVELSKDGMILYKALMEVKRLTVAYFASLEKKAVPERELFFMTETIANTRKGLGGAESTLRKFTDGLYAAATKTQ